MEEAKRDIKELTKEQNHLKERVGIIETRVDVIEEEIKVLPVELQQQITNAVELGQLKASQEQAKEYKENTKWKDRTIIGFLITFFMFALSFVVSILK